MIKMIDFWAQWCAPCRVISPLVDELAKDYNVEKINVDDNNDMALQYNIRSIPTFVFLKDGVEVERIVGVVSKETFVETFEKYK